MKCEDSFVINLRYIYSLRLRKAEPLETQYPRFIIYVVYRARPRTNNGYPVQFELTLHLNVLKLFAFKIRAKETPLFSYLFKESETIMKYNFINF